MRHADRQRWAAAMAAARKRWNSGRVAERARVRDELDALWAELHGQSSGQSLDNAPDTGAGPRHVALGALLAGVGFARGGV